MKIQLASLKADTKRETEGDWIDSPDIPGASFKVSSLLLPAFQVERDNTIRRLAKQHKDGVPQYVLVPEIGKLYAKHILHDWKGFDVEYSPSVAAEILSNYEYRQMVAAIEYCAAKITDKDIVFIEDEVKNSEKPSAKDTA